VNEAATNIENARGPVVAVTAPNGTGRDRGRTLDCSARPGRNPSCTEPPKSRFKESANGSVARGVLFAAFVSASVTTLTLTRETFSWKPFDRGRDRYAPYPSAQNEVSEVRTLCSVRRRLQRSLKWTVCRFLASLRCEIGRFCRILMPK